MIKLIFKTPAQNIKNDLTCQKISYVYWGLRSHIIFNVPYSPCTHDYYIPKEDMDYWFFKTTHHGKVYMRICKKKRRWLENLSYNTYLKVREQLLAFVGIVDD